MAHDPNHDDVPPPSYQESLSSNQNTGASLANRPQPPPPIPSQLSAPPPHPSRPHQTTPHTPPSRPASEDFYNPNPSLPFKFPKGHLCLKCKNSGFKLKNGAICSSCWSKFFTRNMTYTPCPDLPLRFPPGFVCSKCKNTGSKSPSKTCKDCWELYGPRNNPIRLSGYGPQRLVVPAPYGQPAMGMPTRLPPGDPRLGGVLCGRCRGLGLTHFFLDEELCRVCLGLGRIITVPLPQPVGFGGGPPQGAFGGPPPVPHGPMAPYGSFNSYNPPQSPPVQQGSYGYPPQKYPNDLKR